MKNQKQISFAKLAMGTFAGSLVVGAIAAVTLFPVDQPLGGDAHAAWVSTADSVADLVMEADAVVRVQTLDRSQTRHLWHPAPAGAKRGTFAFTDTEVEVLEVYRGEAQVGDRLMVMQTGGDLVTRSGETSRMELAEDPIYGHGSEMVLFLVDISNDRIHSRGRSLFRTVNPAGRYEVLGGLVGRRAWGDRTEALETDLGTLEAEIHQAVQNRQQIESF